MTGEYLSMETIQKMAKLEQIIEQAIEYLEKFKNEWDDSDEIIIDINKLLEILKERK